MASDAEVLPVVGYNFIIKVVRLAFECACYGSHLPFYPLWIPEGSHAYVLRPVGIYLLLISTSTIILWYEYLRDGALIPPA